MRFSKILVVEDFADFRRFVCALLAQRVEFQVTQAADGLAAVWRAEELQPDLILLDIGLPSLNGLEVARRVLKLAPAAKILFLSQESSPDVLREAFSLGARGYVHKSRAQSDLLTAIDAVLRGNQYIGAGLEFGTDDRVPHRHEVQFYSTDAVLLESFTRFLATALRNNDPAIVLATKSHRESIVESLQAQGFAVDAAIQRGTYVSLDAAEMLSTVMVNDVPDVARFFEGLCRLIASTAKAANKECPRIAICGECVGLLCAMGNTDAAVRLEKAGNDLIQTRSVDIMCAYPLGSFDGGEGRDAFKSICAEHTSAFSR